MIDVEEFRVKRKRNRRRQDGVDERAPRTIIKDKRNRDEESDGTPMEVMLRRNTPKLENLIDSESSGTHKESLRG